MHTKSPLIKDDAVYLIDGSGYIFRAYYAIRPLTSSKGVPTNATYGFIQMLLKLLREHQPKYVAIAFDNKTPTFRHELYSGYKANRPPPPEDLIPQFAWIQKVVDAFGIKKVVQPGFEADDLIGTLTKKARQIGRQVIIVTGDKDFMQLVDGEVWLLDELRASKSGAELFVDREGVREKFGVDPEHVVDILALAGDSSDNVPGVRGIGEKTAMELVKEFGSLETILNCAPLMKQKSRREKLMEDSDMARLSKVLVTIKCDVPMDLQIEDLHYQQHGSQELADIFEELEFRRLLSEPMFKVAPPSGDAEATPAIAPASEIDRSKYVAITTTAALTELLIKLEHADTIAISTKTDTQDALVSRFVGISLAWGLGDAAYIPVGHNAELVPGQLSLEQVRAALNPIFASDTHRFIAQNAKSDQHVLIRAGFHPFVIGGDPMLASYLLEADTARHNIDELSRVHLHHQNITHEEVCGKGRTLISFADVPLAQAVPYAAEDVDVAFRLSRILESKVREEGFEGLYRDMELPLEEVLCEMEETGVKIDTKLLGELSGEFATQLLKLEAQAHEIAGMDFNLASPKQVADILFGKLQLATVRKTKTGQSTDADVLEALAMVHPLPKVLLEHRMLSKLKGTYVDALPKLIRPQTGRVHTSFNQAVTATGRLSSSEPNLQNIPIRGTEGRRIRQAFIADEGCVLISLDYSQIELRILADMSKDPVMTDAFMNGEDVHQRTASEIFDIPLGTVTREQRNIAKTINFGLVYGMGAHRLSQTLNISRTDASRYLNRYYERYGGLYAWQKTMLEKAKTQGEVRTIFGRRRKLPEIRSANRVLVQRAERMAINTPIQGSAADIMKKAMIEASRALKREVPGARMLLQVHDELLIEAKESEAQKTADLVEKIMRDASHLAVPTTVDVGMAKSWAEAH
jgi:DNA polymerase-1